MGKVNVTWVQSKQFVGTDSTSHSVVLSSPDDGIGVKPSDLLLLSLAGCTAYDVVNILTKKRVKLTGVQIIVDGEQQPDPPWTFTKIHVHYKVTGIDLKKADVEKAIELSEEKYCSVSNTLKQAVEITHEVEVIDAGA